MDFLNYFSILIFVALACLVSTKPIMVSFGTKQGPIEPPLPTTTRSPNYNVRPAPVSEKFEDLPNPSVYKPLVPQQYRNKILSFKPNPNLILGTAQDQKYLGSSGKYSLLKQQQARAIGLQYKGPQFFEAQEYELDKLRKEYNQERASPKQLFEPIMKPYRARQFQSNFDSVPQIGVVYSSGLRYYIPQFVVYDNNENADSRENSVYY